MVKKKVAETIFLFPETEWPVVSLQPAAQQLANDHQIGFMLLNPGQKLEELLGEAKDKAIHFQEQGRIAVLYNTQDKPSSAVLLENHSYAIECKAAHWRHLQLPTAEKSVDAWQRWLEQQLQAWLMPPDVTDEIAQANLQKVGSKVSVDKRDEVTHFMVGNSPKLMALLDQLDMIKRRFRAQIGSDVIGRREHFKKALDKLLANEGANDKALLDAVKQALEYKSRTGQVKKAFSDIHDPAQLPKVLIIGPSGAGKSFVSRYLSRRTSASAGESLYRPVSRIPIPEYLGDEKRLEFDLFGYCKGAYTDAKERGDAGILLNHIGGVIFLDEIGEASLTLQAKLLAFMDDYKVKPRGWFGEGIFCPVLLVAATNKPVNEWADEDECGRADSIRFRHDLYQRFDSVIHLPGLNERREDLPVLVDALLQLDAVNPGSRIQSISKEAVGYLQNRDYAKGNFRQLRRLLVEGCQRASARQNPVILKRDILQ